jgi:thiamine biosynthesis lipoprotein
VAEAGRVAGPAAVAVDPGGIGKGLAADLVAGALIEAGATGALVSVGGDLAMAGSPPEPAGWRIEVEQPVDGGGVLCTLVVDGGGVATSSTRSRRWEVAGRSHHHVIDPATGTESATDLASVTVFARSGWLAEAFATAALLAGSAAVLHELRRHEVSGVAVTLDGSVLATPDLEPVVRPAIGSMR